MTVGVIPGGKQMYRATSAQGLSSWNIEEVVPSFSRFQMQGMQCLPANSPSTRDYILLCCHPALFVTFWRHPLRCIQKIVRACGYIALVIITVKFRKTLRAKNICKTHVRCSFTFYGFNKCHPATAIAAMPPALQKLIASVMLAD